MSNEYQNEQQQPGREASAMSDLLPCPFCGSPAEFEYTDYNPETGEGDDGMGYARCKNSHCGIGFFDDRDSAIEKWNRRSR